ncbi:butyrophilin-like protein 2 [Notamacropus eugenii]|uniref:butyrophilin-like protein 2 n=1 Tax=Notamacropus eugenii TaxID=9315 RepID=UPI003B66C8F9
MQPILAWVGEDVQLTCHLSPKMDAREMTVKWVRNPLIVHLYRRGQEVKESQSPAFQGRTTMVREDMAEGKVTIIIHKVQLSDTGRYTCYFQKDSFYKETSFDLKVADTFTVSGPRMQPILAWVGEDIQLTCQLSPKMDAREMTVKWVRDPLIVHLYRRGQEVKENQAPAFQGRTTMLREDMAEGKVTIIIHQVQLSDTGQYTCYFQKVSFYNETSFDLKVAALSDSL